MWFFGFSFNDSYIAVGGTGGHVFLLNSVTGQSGPTPSTITGGVSGSTDSLL